MEQIQDLKILLGHSDTLLLYYDKFVEQKITKEVLLTCDASSIKEISHQLELKFGDYIALKNCISYYKMHITPRNDQVLNH